MNMNGMQGMMQMLQMMQQSGNPQQFMLSNFGNNPQFQSMMQMMQGKSPMEVEQMVRQMASQRGINIDNIINMMRQSGIRF